MQLEYQQKLDVISQLFKRSSDAVIVWAPGEGIVFWNYGAERLYGYTDAEALSSRDTHLLKPTFSMAEKEVYRTLFSDGHWQGDVHEITRDGTGVVVSARFQTIMLEDRQFILAINRDITQEREQLHQTRTQSRLLQLCPDAIIVTHPTQGITFWNTGAERLYGYSVSEARGRALKDLLHSEFALPYEDIIDTLERDGDWQGDVVHQTRAGDRVTVSSIVQRYNQDGLDHYLYANRDVTAKRLLQDDLLKLNNELVVSNRELSEFAYIATHDLKEPFRGIAINAHILLRESLPEKAAARVRRMSVLCQHIDQLLSDLLYYSRLSHGDSVERPVDPAKTIALLKAGMSEQLTEKNGVVTLNTDLPLLMGDPLRIKTVFYHLIKNAITYNDAQCRTVDVGFLPCVEQNDLLMQNVFYVRDNGIGIEHKHLDDIFVMFKRLNREADYGFGSGAGLSIVKKIIDGYGGTIAVTSQPNQGATFYFSIPLADVGSGQQFIDDRVA